MSGKPGQKGTKPTVVSGQFTPGFLADLDGRSVVARWLKSNLDTLMTDLGGADTLSYQQRSLCERVIHLEALIRNTETRLAQGEDVTPSSYGQLLNSLVGLYRTLGIERRTTEVVDLRHYLESREASR